jgi:hypothetical protein
MGSGANVLPLPLRERVGVRGSCRKGSETSRGETPPPVPLPQGEGENIAPRHGT